MSTESLEHATRSALHRPGTDDDPRFLRSTARVTGIIGGPFFLITVVLHPARDGHDIAAHANWYILTHTLWST